MFKRISRAAFLVATALAVFSSCKKSDSSNNGTNSITADFTYSGAGTAPANVSFTNTSSGATSYQWDFGDNATSTSVSPSHTYTHGGVFTATLTATGNGSTKSVSKTVNVTAPTSVKIMGVKVLAMPFIDPSTGSGWDNSNGPDVFFKFLDPSNAVLLTGGTAYDVTQSMLPISWTVTNGLLINNLTGNYSIEIWDYDTPDPNDYIGGYYVSFTNAAAAGYPTTLTLQSSTTSLQIQLTLQWQ